MAKGNKLEITIGIKVVDNAIKKVNSKLQQVAQGAVKAGQKLNQMTTKIKAGPVGKLNNALIKVKGSVSKVTSGFNKIRTVVSNSFPVRTVNSLRNGIKKLGDSAKKVGEKFGFLKSNIAKLAGAAAAIFSISAAIGFVNSSIEDYKADMTNATKLKSNIQIVQAYKNDKGTMDKVFNEFQAEASRIQGIGVFGDEMIVGAQAQLSTFQLTNKEINMLMPKIADIVANQKGLNGTAEDFFGVSNMIGKAMSTGMLAPLRKVGIALTEAEMQQFKTLNQTQRAAKLQEILSKNVGNVNEELAKTPLGKIQNAQNAWGDMKERIGEAAINIKGKFAPYLVASIPLVEGIAKKVFEVLGQAADGLIASGGKIKNFFSQILSGINIDGIKSYIDSVQQSFKAMFGNIDLSAVQNAITSVINGITSLLNFIAPVLTPIGAVIGFIINQLAKAMPWLMPIIVAITKIVAVIVGIGVALMALTSPVTWVIAGIMLVITLINNWGTVVNFVMNTIQTVITAVWSFIVGIVSGAIGVIKGIVMTIGGAVQIAVQSVQTFFASAFEGAKNAVKSAIDSMKGFFDGLVGKAREIGGKIAGALNPGNWVKGVANALGGGGKVPKSYIGAKSWRGGLTTVAEKGAEMIKVPGGKPFLAQSEMLLNLPQGTEISTAEATERAFRQFSGENNNSKTTNTTKTSNTTNKKTNNNKYVFAPSIVVENNGGKVDENKILKTIERFFEEKFINMGEA
jgi:hypothetical protein fulcA4_04429